jgi:hypothetical protein
LGQYKLRLAVLTSRGKVLSARVANVNVFGSVPFSTLFPGDSTAAVIGGNGNTGPGTATTTSNTFSYAFGGVTGNNPFVTVSNNTCRSASIVFLPTYPYQLPGLVGSTGSLTVVQESMDPTTATAAFNTTGTLNVALVPGQGWSINIAGSADAEEEIYVYVNGTADCYSAEPFTAQVG